jgi:acyl transferase domain-containing protein/NADPH:quinone reductase-like Zn-dependent oxidoreductase/aryl carrier-like protein
MSGSSSPEIAPRVAVVGMACRFPGAADYTQFWNNVKAGVCSISEIPAERWSKADHYSPNPDEVDKSVTKWGGFIDGFDEFDAAYFGISPREAKIMDPQQRILLEVAVSCLEDAGYSQARIAGTDTAVYLGAAATDHWPFLQATQQPVSAYWGTGVVMSMLANRISYHLNLTGPSMSIDTACSSSLIAVHQGVQALQNGDCTMALVGGISILTTAMMFKSFSKMGMLSPVGMCRTFDEKADGYVRGEGVGLILLKRESEAIADGDRILGFICGSATNHGGHARTVTSPKAFAHARVIMQAHLRAGITPDSVSYIEAHGTGTPVGDPIEIVGLKRAFAKLAEHSGVSLAEKSCAIGSVKPNVGHLEPVAGITGLIKVLLCMQHGTLPGLVHLQNVNPRIDLEGSPFYLLKKSQPWHPAMQAGGQPYPRRAGVSSFGFGGSNAHVVLEEAALAPPRRYASLPAYLVCLSARTPQALRRRFEALADWLGRNGDVIEMLDVSSTLLRGRQHWEYRSALVVQNARDLEDKLRRSLQQDGRQGDYQGDTLAKVPDPERCATLKEVSEKFLDAVRQATPLETVDYSTGLQSLAESYVNGLSLDFAAVFAGLDARPIALPTYPFEKKRYSVIAEEPSSGGAATARVAVSKLQAINRRPRISLSALTSRSEGVAQSEIVPLIDPPAERKAVQEMPAGARAEHDSILSGEANGQAGLASIEGKLRDSLAAALYLRPEDVDLTRPFVEQGLDSVVGVEWVRSLNATFRLNIAVTKLYDYSNIRALAVFVEEQLGRPSAAAASGPAPARHRDTVGAAGAGTAAGGPRRSSSVVKQELRQSLAKALYLDEHAIREDQPFVDLGLDSVVGVEWVRTLNQRYALAMQATRLYDYATIEALASHIVDELQAQNGEPSARATGDGIATVLPSGPPPGSAPAIAARSKAAVATATPHLETNYGLTVATVESLDAVLLKSWAVGAAGDDEVTIRVLASAVGFPDVMCVQGLYPTMPAYPFVPGFEVSGVVSAVGSGVSAFSVGDEVVALTGPDLGGHASHVNVPRHNVFRKPRGMSHEEACSIPVAFLTVWYAYQAARLQAGEHVLVQTATGGCGLAALQLARRHLCTCYGTTSQPEKLAILRAIGVEHVINYKTTAFDAEISRISNGRGVDVVLNTLSGDAIQRGLNCLAPFGRYLELAVHGLRTSPKLDLSRLVRNQSVLSIDMRRLTLEGGATWGACFEALGPLFETGELVPILSRIYPVSEIAEALRYVAQGKHIGKVVISHTAASIVDCTQLCIDRMVEQQRRCRSANPPSAFAGAAPRRPDPAPAAPVTEAIAVIGMAGQFPQAGTLDEFWLNLTLGKDCVTEVPAERWTVADHFQAGTRMPGKTYCKWMGAIENVDEFDPLFFNIAPAEACLMDPEQRLFLQNVWHCFEDAGILPSSVSGKRCGVFVGCAPGDYGQLLGPERLTAHGLMGGAASILSGRVAYFFNLQGPCLSIDTACSSSLAAIAQACDSLVARTSDLALAGGAYVMSGPSMHIMTSQAGMLSERGRCRTFDQAADGFVPSEGVGVVLLKRLSDAERDKDRIYGVVKGWGIKQDGKTNGITAPSVNSQIALQKDIYDRFAIDPARITLVEAHGTGTKLGDPIEVEALTQSFRAYTDKKQYCALGSVKTNIGHGLPAAGISGFVKVMMCLWHRKLVPSIHYTTSNEHISFVDSPFFVNTAFCDWDPGASPTRQAAMSSFGFSGTNVHLVMEEGPAKSAGMARDAVAQDGEVLIVLSAKSEGQLKEQARLLHRHLTTHEGLSIADVAYTLQTGREPMACRLAFAAASRAAVLEKLEKCGRGERPLDVSVVLEGSAKGLAPFIGGDADGRELVRTWMRKKMLEKLAQLWTEGLDLDWAQLHGVAPPRRVTLPGYPFARERYWLPPGTSVGAPKVNRASEAVLHPLLHQNASTFGEQRFVSEFSGDEFFFSDHRVRQKRMLPAVAYLEMALAAAGRSAGPPADASAGIRLHDITWIRPIVSDAAPLRVSTILARHGSERIGYEICTESQGEDGRRIVCARGSVRMRNADVRPRLDLASLRASCREGTLDAARCYAAFSAVGLDYGPGHQGLECLYRGMDRALGKLRLNDGLRGTLDQYILHPAILDSALQAAIGLLADDTGSLSALALPYSLTELQVFGPCTADMWTFVRRSTERSDTGGQCIDVDLSDENGNVSVRLLGFSLRPAALREASGVIPDSRERKVGLLECQWQDSEITPCLEAAEQVHAERVAVLCELEGLDKEGLQARLAGVHCVFIDWQEGDIAQRFQSHAAQVLGQIKRLFRRSLPQPLELQLVYPDRDDAQALAGFAGMVRTAQLENPKFRGQLIGVDRTPGTDAFAALIEAENRSGAPRVRYQEGRRLVPVWQVVAGKTRPSPPPWKKDGVYLITGGAGALGFIFAEEIVRKSPTSHIVLIGRSTLSAGQRARMREFWTLGGSVEYRQADVGDLRAVEDLIGSIVQEHGRLDGIIHGAGALQDALIRQKNLAQVSAVLAPKVRGVVNLDTASRSIDLDFFVAFSSMAGIVGNVGQADYAAGNAFMDAYAAYRDGLVRRGQRKGRTLSIAWPLWTVGGMKVDRAVGERIKRKIGAADAEEGKLAFYRALSETATEIAVTAAKSEELAAYRGEVAPDEPAGSLEAVGTWDKDRVRRFVTATIARVLKVSADRLMPTTNFDQYGVDSIVQTTLIHEMETVFGELPKTLLFEYPNIQELVEFLAAGHAPRLTPREPRQEVPVGDLELPSVGETKLATMRGTNTDPKLSRRAPRERDIAIIGTSARYPGSASLDELWQNLVKGVNCVTLAPADRWKHGLTRSLAAHASKHDNPEYFGGFLSDIDRFDHRLFGVTWHEALHMAPELRLLLEVAWETFEDAGYNRARLQTLQEQRESGVGVFVGSMYSQYAWSMSSIEEAAGYSNESDWQIANRLSHFFDLRGPSMAVNTACSSSMTAMHLACESLRQQSCAMAMAGGVNLTLDRSKYERLRQAGFLETGSESRSFGRGSGYIPGEGAGLVLLKPLALALKDGDRIDGVIKSSVVNHSGGRQKYAAPDPKRQAELIADSIKQANIEAETITYVEAAANGSPLGDPIEVVALRKVFERNGGKRGSCAIGSVKSNLGHLEAASGISQLNKVLLQLKNRVLVPTLHAEPLNPAIQLDGGVFRLQRETEAWQRIADPTSGAELPRRSMINSFGIGGTYGNLIVEEFLAPAIEAAEASAAPSVEVCVFSAMTCSSLLRRIDALRRFVANSPDVAVADVAASLRKINNDLPHRAAVLAASKTDLVTKLAALYEAGDAASGTLVTLGVDDVDLPVDCSSVRALEAWASGQQFRIEGCEDMADRPCLSLPKYCFDHDLSFKIGGAGPQLDSGSEGADGEKRFRPIFEKIARGELSEEAAWQLMQGAEA